MSTIDIIQDHLLKGLDCHFPSLQTVPNGSVVEIRQKSARIYAKYSPLDGAEGRKVRIPSKLCELNNISEGSGQVIPVMGLNQCNNLIAYVSSLEWQVINSQTNKLEEEFLNQIQVVWPGAKIPLFYDKANSVTLRIDCEKVSLLGENSQIQILVDPGEIANENKESKRYELTGEQIQVISTPEGNINKVYLMPNHPLLREFDSKTFEEINNKYQIRLNYTKEAQTITPELPCDTFKLRVRDQIEAIKGGNLNCANNTKTIGPPNILVRVELLPLEFADLHSSHRMLKEREINENENGMQEDKEELFLSEGLIENWGISVAGPFVLELIPRTDTNEPECKNLEHLLNSKDFEICTYVSDRDSKSISNIESLIAEHLVECLYVSENNDEQTKSESICSRLTIFGKVPYIIVLSKKSIGTTKKIPVFIEVKQSNKVIADPLTIINKKSSKFNESREDLLKKLNKHLNVTNYFYEDQSEATVGIKIAVLNRLTYAINRSEMNCKIEQTKTTQSKESFLKLYKVCYEEEIDKLLSFIKEFNEKKQASYDPILISSYANNGKTLLNEIIAEQFSTLYIDMCQLDDLTLNVNDVLMFLELSFQLCSHSIIFFDNLDAVCYNIESGDIQRRQERIAAKLIIRKLIAFMKTYNKLCVFTCKNEAGIDTELHHFNLIKLKNPNRETRLKAINQYSENNSVHEDVIGNSESMSFGEFTKFLVCGYREPLNNEDESKASSFSKLAGIKEAKKLLRRVIEKPLKYSQVYKKLPIKLSRGILLYGGSGTGKTAIGECLAGEFHMKYFQVKGSDILSKYIGGSEEAVRDIFEKAMSVSPSIIFFDEFESIVPRRNSSNTGVTDRVVNQFLCYLDGVASVEGVYILAASSRPELIDPALLRPGRIDTHIFLDFPSAEERKELFELYENSIQFESSMEEIVNATDGFSYSDLIGLIKELRIKQSARVIKDYTEKNNKELQPGVSIAQNIDPSSFKFIDSQFLYHILSTYKISVSKQQQDREREKYLAFKRGDPEDVSKQRTILQ